MVYLNGVNLLLAGRKTSVSVVIVIVIVEFISFKFCTSVLLEGGIASGFLSQETFSVITL